MVMVSQQKRQEKAKINCRSVTCIWFLHLALIHSICIGCKSRVEESSLSHMHKNKLMDMSGETAFTDAVMLKRSFTVD